MSPPLANTPASGSQQAAQLSPGAAPPAECLEPNPQSEPSIRTLNPNPQSEHIELNITIRTLESNPRSVYRISPTAKLSPLFLAAHIIIIILVHQIAQSVYGIFQMPRNHQAQAGQELAADPNRLGTSRHKAGRAALGLTSKKSKCRF